MATLTRHDYMLSDGRTHRWWWTWVPAHPLSRHDKWYGILERVFADRTANCISQGGWRGFYTEHMKGKTDAKQEGHMTIGFFQSFSALPTYTWAESLLQRCSVPFVGSIRDVTWQYEMQGAGLHADIALRIVDGNGPADPLVLIIEAKAAKGRLKDKDLDGSYKNLPQIANYRRRHVALLLDKGDVAAVPKRVPIVTWQGLAALQREEFAKLNLIEPAKAVLDNVLQAHLAWYGFCAKPSCSLDSAIAPSVIASLEVTRPRLAALVRGGVIVLNARRRLPVDVPLNFGDDHGIEDYPRLAKEGRAVFKGTASWEAVCW